MFILQLNCGSGFDTVLTVDFTRLRAGITDDHQLIALFVSAVFKVTGLGAAVDALADVFGLVAEFDAHPLVEYVQRALPETFVAVGFAVLHDAAVNLIDLFEALLFHEHAQHFAADAEIGRASCRERV